PDAANGLPALLVNARLVPSALNCQILRDLIAAGRPGIIASGPAVAAAFVDASGPMPPTSADATRFSEYLQQSIRPKLPRLEVALSTLDYPHDLIRHHLQIIDANLAHRIRSGRFQEIASGVFAAAGA